MTIPLVLSQHAEEAAFNWLLRDLAVWAPHYDLKDLARLDGRVEAHVDGLRIGGDPGWEIVREELGWKEAGEVFMATLLALEAGSRERLEEALTVASESTELARGAISALGWLAPEQAIPWAMELLDSGDPMLRRIGIGGAAVHRHDPGDALQRAIVAEEGAPKSRALKAAGELGRRDLLSHCQAHYAAEESDVRMWAAWSGALLGDVEAIHALAELAGGEGARAVQVTDLAARRMPLERAHAWWASLAESEPHARLAVQVATALGDPALVPWLLDMMAVEELARPAGEAFSMLTGLDLAYEDLEADAPEGFEAGPTEDPADEDVALDVDEDLPWPDPELLREWWGRNGSGFSPGTRYLRGEPHSPEVFMTALREGRQRQRNAAALEVALSDPARPLYETRAPGFRQQAFLRR